MGMLMDLLKAQEQLEAQERLNAISDSAVASGGVKRSQVTKHVRQLERMAGIRKPRSASLNELQAVGIQSERVPR